MDQRLLIILLTLLGAGPKVTGADMAASDILVDAVEVVLSLETAGGTVAKCELPDDAALPIGVLFRAGSPMVRAASLIEINRLVDHYRLCNGATVRLSPTLTSSSEASSSGLVGDDEQRLLERRQQEIKYHLMQRRIPRADIDIRNMPAESGQDTQ